MVQLVIKNGKVVTPSGVQEVGIVVNEGKILGLVEDTLLPPAEQVIDAEGRFVIPGAIDTHAHLGQVGREYAHLPGHTLEGNFCTESRAAVAGGVTTALSYAVFSQGSLKDVVPREQEVVGRCSLVDVLFHGYLMNETHLDEIDDYIRGLGIRSFKIFLPYRGKEALDLGGLSSLTDAQIYRAFKSLSHVPGVVAMIHAEDGDIVDECTSSFRRTGRQDLAAWDASRPDYAEGDAVLRVLYLARKTGCTVGIAHLSSGEGLEAVERFGYFRALVETCPHYLALSTDLDLGPLGKVAPPLRSRRDVDRLWEGILKGTVHFIGSDHNSWPAEAKQELWDGLAGLPGVGMILPVMFTEGYDRRGLPVERIVELTSANAARTFGLWPRKGAIQVGSDADLVIMEVGIRKPLCAELFPSCIDYTPYQGYVATAWPYAVVVRGQVVSQAGTVSSVHPARVLNGS